MMKVNIVCVEEKTTSIKKEIEELDIEVVSCNKEDGLITVETSEEGYEKVIEIAGVLSASKADIFNSWR
jgi:hypothetical protein